MKIEELQGTPRETKIALYAHSKKGDFEKINKKWKKGK